MIVLFVLVLLIFRHHHRSANPDFHNAPVPSWISNGDLSSVELLIIGLAPGLKGANRTGRPFTGDFAGSFLYETLIKFGFAVGKYGADPNDGLELHRTAVTNAVRCLPPQNKPIASEINTCRPFLLSTMSAMKNLKLLITLGGIAHTSTVRALNLSIKDFPFIHDLAHNFGSYMCISSYHCSRYNTQTRRLTRPMFESVFAQASSLLGD